MDFSAALEPLGTPWEATFAYTAMPVWGNRGVSDFYDPAIPLLFSLHREDVGVSHYGVIAG